MSVKIIPKINVPEATVTVNDLVGGDCFLLNGELHMLFDSDPKSANISLGEEWEHDGHETVIPVDIEIHWKKKANPKKKK